METYQKPHSVKNQEMLITFFDLSGFARILQKYSSNEVFEMFSGYYEFVGDIVESSGGTIIKFIADSG